MAKIALEFVPNAVWIGAFWFAQPGRRYLDPEIRRRPDLGFRPGDPCTDKTEAVTRWDVYLCPLPCLPLHFTWFRPRVVVPALEAQRP